MTADEILGVNARCKERQLADRRFKIETELAHMISEHHRIARQRAAVEAYLATEPLRRAVADRALKKRELHKGDTQ